MNTGNIRQYLTGLDFWGWIVLAIVVLAATMIIWRLIPFLKRIVLKLWAQVLKKKDNLNRAEIFLISIILELLVAALFITPAFILPVKLFLRGGILALGLFVFLVATFLLIYFGWAPNNLFFTFVPEGRAKVVVRGDAVKRVLLQWRGYELNKNWDVIKSPSQKKPFLGGLRFIGWLFPLDDIYIYNFTWTSVNQAGEFIKHPKEVLDFILVQDDIYLLVVEEAEDNQQVPLDVSLFLTLGIVNPFKALFRIQDWLEATNNLIAPAVRDCITRQSFEDWISQPKDLGKEIEERLKTDKLIAYLKSKYGVALKKIGVKDIDPSGDFRALTTKKVTAKKEAEVVEIAAGAEKKRITTVYETVKSLGETGMQLRTLEALEKSPEKGAKWVVPIPDILSRIFHKDK